jgi:hypothetical protein
VELLPSKLATGEGTLANELREALLELGQLDHVVIFIDEFDEIAPARESRPASAGVVNQLLKSIPELRRRPGKLLICATNFVNTIDPAVMRPGRFDLLIGIGPPDQAALSALWEHALSIMQLQPGVDATALAASCRGFTPGDVDLARSARPPRPSLERAQAARPPWSPATTWSCPSNARGHPSRRPCLKPSMPKWSGSSASDPRLPRRRTSPHDRRRAALDLIIRERARDGPALGEDVRSHVAGPGCIPLPHFPARPAAPSEKRINHHATPASTQRPAPVGSLDRFRRKPRLQVGQAADERWLARRTDVGADP